jgi:hypothetical protein
MARLVERMTAFLHGLVRPMRDRLLAKLRAHVALAVNDDLRQLALHVTAERLALAAELTQQLAAELAAIRRQLDDLNVCNDGLLREVVRLRRELRQLTEAFEPTSPPGSLDDASQLSAGLAGVGETFRKAA